MSRTFFRQKSVLNGKREDRDGNNTDPTGKDIDSPEQKKTVPDFFMPSLLLEANGWTKVDQNTRG